MLVQLNPKASARLMQQMTDFSLLVDSGGCIRELSINNEELAGAVDESWLNNPWSQHVAADSRTRLEEMLQQSIATPGVPVIRDITHILADGTELLVQYRTVGRENNEGAVAFGRDMRPMANLRQQLMNAQHALEQDYWRLRQIETRYRRLFDMISDAIIVLDGESLRVIEANPQASRLLTADAQSIIGKTFPLGVNAAGERAIRSAFEEARSTGKASVQGLKSQDGEHSLDLFTSYLRQDKEARFLVRLSVSGGAAGAANDEPREQFLQEPLRSAPDAVILTDEEGRLLAANKTFLDLAQALSEDQVMGQLADRWLGRSGVDLSVLLTNLRKNNSVKLFGTTLQGEMGSVAEVEISADSIDGPQGRTFAFFIRDVGRRMHSENLATPQLPRSIEQITKRVGRVPLKELVRESTDIIEALCIESALKLTHDNRASAAELLGLSRQSLYAKLRRHGVGGSDDETE